MKNPDKHIRKAFSDALSDLEVTNPYNSDEVSIPLSDFRIPQNKDFYILMTNQWTMPRYDSKCDKYSWTCGITLDIVTKFANYQGSRLFADEIKEAVMNLTEDLTIENFNKQRQDWNFPDDLEMMTSTENIYRKIIQYEFELTEELSL